MKRSGADSSAKVLQLFVKLDDLLRMSWARDLSPEDHLWDYESSPLTAKYLRQPLIQLQNDAIQQLALQKPSANQKQVKDVKQSKTYTADYVPIDQT